MAIIASESTQSMAPGFVWLELDRVRVKGKAQAVAIYSPVATLHATEAGRPIYERFGFAPTNEMRLTMNGKH